MKKFTSIELIIFVSIKKPTPEFNSSNKWSYETIENKELSLPSSYSFLLGEIVYVIYNIEFSRKVEIFAH